MGRLGSGQIGSPAVAAVAGGTVLLTAFTLHALRTTAPLIEIALLRRGRFAAAAATSASMYGGLLLLPLYLQHDLGQSPAEAGLMLLVMGVGSAVALPLAGLLTDRHGAGRVSLAGSLLLLIATIPFLLQVPSTLLFVAVILMLRGTGLAMAQMPAMTAAYASVNRSETGDASTLVNIAQRVGGALGTIAVVVLLEHGNEAPSEACRWAFAALVLLAIGSTSTAALLVPGNRQAK